MEFFTLAAPVVLRVGIQLKYSKGVGHSVVRPAALKTNFVKTLLEKGVKLFSI